MVDVFTCQQGLITHRSESAYQHPRPFRYFASVRSALCVDPMCGWGRCPIISLQFHGPARTVGDICQMAVDDLVRMKSIRPPTLLHVTQDSVTASRQAEMLVHFPLSRS
ncbi:unnamed protein product [Mesocestoides corti]|uniref:Uncharacterized protein n=1 Tax=Mesocestoides corti TaxID=53468 RepID=A0A0R3U3W9_MESCO|nr:unnamed protein product [Mesocestoides corti]